MHASHVCNKKDIWYWGGCIYFKKCIVQNFWDGSELLTGTIDTFKLLSLIKPMYYHSTSSDAIENNFLWEVYRYFVTQNWYIEWQIIINNINEIMSCSNSLFIEVSLSMSWYWRQICTQGGIHNGTTSEYEGVFQELHTGSEYSICSKRIVYTIMVCINWYFYTKKLYPCCAIRKTNLKLT